MQEPLYPRIFSLGSMLGFGTTGAPAVPPSDQTSAEHLAKASEQFGVKATRDTFNEDHPQE